MELSKQVVTGTRLIGGDPSAKVFSISAEEISRRGVSNLEDLFRTLPYAFGSTTTQSNMFFGNGALDTDESLGALGLGTSTVNLRALGSANTLVLVDGRRIAGDAGRHSNFANILNVPLAAVERVDIQLDGASAVYGSDAIGGVVNFILRKDFRGLTATARNEWSGTDSDRRKLDVLGGFSWDTGNMSATLSHSEDKPINNFKIWTSKDFRDDFGPEFDLRSRRSGQPGVVCEFDPNPFGRTNQGYIRPFCGPSATYLQLPQGSGVGATPDDFSNKIKPFDLVIPQNGADATTSSIEINVEQYITDDLRIYASALVSKRDDYQQNQFNGMTYVVPASNAYNPFGRTVIVSYYPLRELQEGRIPWAYTESENKQRNYAAGFYWQLADKHQLQLDFSHSESRKRSWQITTSYRRERGDPSAETFYRALDSSDPDVALNLFGDGTAQGSAFEELFTNTLGPTLGFTDITTIKPYVRGEIFEIWGGPARYVIGGESMTRKVYSYSYQWGPEGQARRENFEDAEGVRKPTQENTAWYVELALPLASPDNSWPGLHSLQLSLQLRRDSHDYEGANGGPGWKRVPAPRWLWIDGGWVQVPFSRQVYQGDPNIVGLTKSDDTWRAGLSYQPLEELTVRASWTTTFKPPKYNVLFDVRNPTTRPSTFVDPYNPDGPTEIVRPPTTRSAFNPDIKSETGRTVRIVADWTPPSVPGLTLSADWSKAVHKDKIDYTFNILNTYPEVGFKLDSIVKRDADGRITQVNYFDQINLAEKVNELLILYGEYSFQTRLGDFNPRLTYTRVLDEYFTVVPGTPAVDRVGTIKGSDKYKLQGSLTWLWNRFAADLFVDYSPSYENNRTGRCGEVVGRCLVAFLNNRPTIEVDSLTTVDLTLTYQFDNGLRLRGGGRNILYEKSYTVFDGNLPYDPTRWNARGRVFFLELQYEM